MQVIRFISVLLFITVSPAVSAADSINLGVFPYLSAEKLLRVHNPLAIYLSENLNQPVNLISAPGFAQFMRRTRQHKYDIIVTAPHMGTLAVLQSNYQRIAVSSNKSHAVFVSLKKSRFNDLNNIQTASITLPPEKAIISQLAIQKLVEQGFEPDELDIDFTQSHNNALKSVLIGDSDIAAFGLPTWHRTSEKDKSKLQVLGISEEIPGFMILANDKMPAIKIQEISHLLQTYHLSKAGKSYFKNSRLQNFRAITDQDIADLKPYVKAIFKLK